MSKLSRRSFLQILGIAIGGITIPKVPFPRNKPVAQKPISPASGDMMICDGDYWVYSERESGWQRLPNYHYPL